MIKLMNKLRSWGGLITKWAKSWCTYNGGSNVCENFVLFSSATTLMEFSLTLKVHFAKSERYLSLSRASTRQPHSSTFNSSTHLPTYLPNTIPDCLFFNWTIPGLFSFLPDLLGQQECNFTTKQCGKIVHLLGICCDSNSVYLKGRNASEPMYRSDMKQYKKSVFVSMQGPLNCYVAMPYLKTTYLQVGKIPSMR